MRRHALISALLVAAATDLRAQCADANAPLAPRTPGLSATPETVRGFMSGRIGANDLTDMRQWGANVVRLQIHIGATAQRMGKSMWDAWPIVLDTIDAQVRRAGAAGLKVVVDIHDAPIVGVPNDRTAMWLSPELTPNFCRVWADVARRLLPVRSMIWGYDLYNEPLNRDQWPNAPSGWHALADQITHTIRTIDADTWVIYESGPGGYFFGFNNLTPIHDSRTIYSSHIYVPNPFCIQGTPGGPPAASVHYPGMIGLKHWDRGAIVSVVQPAIDFQNKYHVPIYIGEFSVARFAPHDDAVHWLQDVVSIMEEHHWSWSYHAFREWNGWSLEYDETPLPEGQPDPGPVSYITDRAKVIRDAFRANARSASTP